MKYRVTRLMVIGFAAIGFCGATAALADEPVRIAYVEVETVARGYKKMSEAVSHVKRKIDSLKTDTQVKKEQLDKLEKEIRGAKGVLSESVLGKKRDRAKALSADIRSLENQAEDEVAGLDKNIFTPMVSDIEQAVQSVAAEKNIDLVLREDGVIYSARKLNITDAVIARLNSTAAGSGVDSHLKTQSAGKSSESHR